MAQRWPSAAARDHAAGDAQALAYIARHHGLPPPSATALPADAAGLEQLCFSALNAGLHSRAVRLDAASLQHLQLPCLLLHRHLGWTPLIEVNESQVTLQHPTQGRLHVAVDTLAMEFSGLALELRPAR